MVEDVRFGQRGMRRAPAFAVAAILTLALGIGANTLVFSIVDHVLFRPFPYEEPDRLAFLWNGSEGRRTLVSLAEVAEWRERTDVFEGLGAWTMASYSLGADPNPDHVWGMRATASLFTTLGVKALHGRLFLPGEERTGHDNVAVLSYPLWRSRFGGNTGIVGTEVDIDRSNEGRKKYTVIGVLPPEFQAAFPSRTDLWTPIAFDAPQEFRGNLWALGRLRSGVSPVQAEAAVPSLQPDRFAFKADSFHEHLTGEKRPMLLSLGGAVLFVLLIASVNAANLLLARASNREGEMAIRAALGASRARLFRQSMTESLLLALAGGAAGAAAAYASVGFVRALAPGGIPRWQTIAVDPRVLAFTLAASALTGLLFGVLPALRASRRDPISSLQTVRAGAKIRGLLVVSEIALGLVLVTAAGLMLNSFVRLLRTDPGFQAEGLLSIVTSLLRQRYKAEARWPFIREYLDRVQALPGVRHAGLTDTRPMSDRMTSRFAKAGAPGAAMDGLVETIAGDYFEAMGTPLSRGRGFAAHDTPVSTPVAIVNETMARALWPDQEPIGQTFLVDRWNDEPLALEVIGVAGDVRHRGPAIPAGPIYYRPQSQAPSWRLDLVVRAERDEALPLLVPAIRAQLAALDPELTVEQTALMTDVLARAVSQPRLLATLLGAFGLLALALTVTGVYGVMAYSARLRTHEIGVRMAVGAASRDVTGLLLRSGLKYTAAGIALGAAGALAAARVLEAYLYGVEPGDPATFAVAAVVLAAAALLAGLGPARRAARIDPMAVLRRE